MVLVVLAMPVLTVGVAAATGTLQAPEHGWAREALLFLLLFVLIALTASLWEETAWSGFVQRRLMNRHGLLVGSLLTAVPFGIIHLPLAFEGDGWAGTTWSEAFVNWAFLLGALPFLRYVIGVLLVDTRGSVLAALPCTPRSTRRGRCPSYPRGGSTSPRWWSSPCWSPCTVACVGCPSSGVTWTAAPCPTALAAPRRPPRCP